MTRSSLLRVMISSRCLTVFDGRKLSDIRLELKEEIDGLDFFGHTLFETWINEKAPPKYAGWNSTEVCLDAVRSCDILLVLSNGHAGWADEKGGVGICHAELLEGINLAPGKVRLIDLGRVPVDEKTEEGRRNKLFQDDLDRYGIFHGGRVSTVDELKVRVRHALFDAVVSLTQAGVWDARGGGYNIGSALDWSHLDFEERERRMRRVLSEVIKSHSSKPEPGEEAVVALGGERVLLVPHAIPAALSISQAKEMVGQPFLRDHEYNEILMRNKCGGPLHIIACQKTATELQAIKLLGFPDATVVSAPFGVFVADNIQKVQFAFIVNCRDESTTRRGAQKFFTWLKQSREDEYAARRAKARAAIVKAIAANLKEGSAVVPTLKKLHAHPSVKQVGFSKS